MGGGTQGFGGPSGYRWNRSLSLSDHAGQQQGPRPPPTTGSGRNSTGWGRSTWGGRGRPRPGCGPPPSPHPFCCDPSCLPHASGTEALWSALAGQRCPGRQSSNAHKPQPTPGTCADTRVHRAPGQTLSRTHTHSCARTRPESLPLSACDQTWCECGAQCLEKAPSTVEPRVTGEAGASVAGKTAVS